MNAGPKCRARHFGPYADRLVMPRSWEDLLLEGYSCLALSA